ncbi:MBL fold metallo-hydrolase RNA specificity domain-containing protein [Vibrio cincinnatiensis]|uniref:MBL fold metallo-hydrolase RNA specificity domain-containing protein n=1 Tax=Vibrio cincinnatiensis TaxID=675 RepID=UPI0038A8D846
MQLIHHGGKNTVTGSCHELVFGDRSILIDCGMFQGADAQQLTEPFPLDNVKALVLTHAHIDHIGRLPWLITQEFDKPIYCTKATAELVPLMLDDGLKIQQGLTFEARKPIIEAIIRLLHPVDYYRWIDVDTFRCRFNPAGHILGSAYVEVMLPTQEVVVFSGDLGPSNTPLLPDPKPPKRADYLVIETTYGHREHEGVEYRAQQLRAIIERSLADGGTILIPAFSVGRTQELLFDIERLVYEKQIDADLPIILDSPMAQKVTQSYRRFKALWGQEAKERLEKHRHPLAFEQCIQITDYRSHQALVNRLASTGEPAIVVAASGMCEGGRIVDYLKVLLSDSRTDVIFAGFQAEGTLGRAIQQGESVVCMDGEEVEINANIHVMSGYSAHADQSELLHFIDGIEEKPQQIHLIHGEREAQRAFAALLREKGYSVVE